MKAALQHLAGHVGRDRGGVFNLVGLDARLRGVHINIFAEVEDCATVNAEQCESNRIVGFERTRKNIPVGVDSRMERWRNV